MLNSGKKTNSRFTRQKKYILTLELSEKKILNETKNHNLPPFKLNGRTLIYIRESFLDELVLKSLFYGSFSERGSGVKVQNWPHIILKNNARHRIKTIY